MASFLPPVLHLSCCRSRSQQGVSLSSRNSRKARQANCAVRGDNPSPQEDEDGVTGDKKLQDTLVEMVALQKREYEVDELVREKSKFLTEIAESAQEEFEKIASDVNKGMDELSSKVLEEMDSDVSELERDLAQSRAQIEADELELEEYEREVAKSRSEGLFFKSLFQPIKKKKPSLQVQQEIKVEASKVDAAAKDAVKSPARRNIYIALALVLALSIAEAAASGESWEKVAVYAALLLFLLLQIAFERSQGSVKK